MSSFEVTCVILTCDSYNNKGGCIEHTILCILNQSLTPEIIIVDNSKSIYSRKQLKNFLNTVNRKIMLIEIEDSIAKGRNAGARKAEGKVIVFIDDDTLLIDKLGLEKILYSATSFDYGYGATRYWTNDVNWFLTHKDKLLIDLKHDCLTFLRKNIGEPCPSIRKKSITKYLTRSFIGNFGFINNNAFKKVGGFPEIFNGYGLEDDAFSFLLFMNYGSPKSLADIEIVHISHHISDICYNSLEYNQNLYQDFLNSYGYKAFYIGDLLYPENKRERYILEQ